MIKKATVEYSKGEFLISTRNYLGNKAYLNKESDSFVISKRRATKFADMQIAFAELSQLNSKDVP